LLAEGGGSLGSRFSVFSSQFTVHTMLAFAGRSPPDTGDGGGGTNDRLPLS
jgi:hypothetical protein